MKKLCKICKKLKVKLRKTERGEMFFVNQRGKKWRGKICPECIKVYSKQCRIEKYAPKREDEKSCLLGPNLNPDPLTKRKCRECNKRLPKSRYFLHSECEDRVHFSEGQGFYGAEDWGYGCLTAARESTCYRFSETNLLGAQ